MLAGCMCGGGYVKYGLPHSVRQCMCRQAGRQCKWMKAGRQAVHVVAGRQAGRQCMWMQAGLAVGADAAC